MIETLSVRDRRALALGLALIGGLVLALRGIPAWWRWRSDVRASAAEAIKQERRVQATIAGFSQSLDTLSDRVDRLKRMGPAFLRGETPAEAASMLAAAVSDIARASLVRIDAIQLRADSARTDTLELPRVKVEAQATGDVAGLAALLHGLEKGPLLLSVQRLSVRTSAVDAPPDQTEALTIQFTVEGLALLR